MSNTNTNLPTQTSSVLHNDTISSCSISKVQEKARLSKEGCIKSLKALQSKFTFLTDTLQDFGQVPIFKRTFSQDMDLLEQQLTKEIPCKTDCKTTLTNLRTTFENAFNSKLRECILKYTRFNTQSFRDAIIKDMDFIMKYMLEIILHQQEIQQLLNEKKLQTQEVQSNTVQELKVDPIIMENTYSRKDNSNSDTALSKSVMESSSDSKTKDVHAIKYKMSKVKERCMAYFRSLHSHLQVLSKEDLKGSRIEHGFKRAFMSLFVQDDDTFTSTMLLNVDQLQKQLDKDEFQEDGSMAAFWVINRQFQQFIDSQFTLDYDSQMTNKYFAEYTVIEVKQFRDTLLQHMGNVKKFVAERTLDVDLVVIESSETESEVQDDSSGSGNDTDDDADIGPIYDEEPMAEVQLTAEYSRKVFAIAALKNELRKLKENSVDTKFAKTSVLGKPVLQSLRNQSIVRQPTVFKSERPKISKPRFASQVDVKSDLSKPVTQHYLPKGKESAFAKLNHMIASSSFRNSSKNMSRFSSNDMILAPCTSKDDSEPTHGSNVDIPNIHECQQTLDLSAGKSQSMVAEKVDISETSVIVDSQMMKLQ
ncbi:hypothetical protein Tco_0559152 [Tanacetum coccineum]